MSDLPAPGTASPPPALGEGCVRRYDPEALTPEHGADFAEAAALWKRLQSTSDEASQSHEQGRQ